MTKPNLKMPAPGTAMGFLALVGTANAKTDHVIVRRGDIAKGAVTANALAKGAVHAKALAAKCRHLQGPQERHRHFRRPLHGLGHFPRHLDRRRGSDGPRPRRGYRPRPRPRLRLRRCPCSGHNAQRSDCRSR